MAHRRLIVKERITAIIGASLLLALVAISYYYSVRVVYDGLKYVPSKSSPDFTAQDIVLTEFSENGSPKGRLSASNVAHFSDERMRAENARILSTEPNKPLLQAKSDEAWSNDGLETIELSGNVTISRQASKNEPKLEFKTDHIKGFLDTYTFETNKPVSMYRGSDYTHSSNGMIYSNVDQTIELTGNVQTILHPRNQVSNSK